MNSVPTIIRLLFALIVGILFSEISHSWVPYTVVILFLLAALLAIGFYAHSKFLRRLSAHTWSGVALMLFVLMVGMFKAEYDHPECIAESSHKQLRLEVLEEGKFHPRTISYEVKDLTTSQKYLLYTRSEQYLLPGDIIESSCVVYPLSDTIDYHRYLYRQGCSATLYAAEVSCEKRDIPFGLAHIRRCAIRLKDWANSQMEIVRLPDSVKALGLGCLFGDKSGFSSEVKKEFSYAGMSHVLAVSGLHVGVLYAIFGLFLWPLRLLKCRNIRYIISLLLIWVYVAIIGFPASAVRAATMLTMVVVFYMLERRSLGWHSLGLSAFLLLIYDTQLLWSLSFQMSFLATAGIFFIRPELKALARWRHEDKEKPRTSSSLHRIIQRLWRYLSSWVASALLVSFAAQIFTLPIVLHYFHHLPLLSFIPTLLVIPLLTLYLALLLLFFGLQWWIAAVDGISLLDVIQAFIVRTVKGVSEWILQVSQWTHNADIWLFGDVAWYPSRLEMLEMYVLIIVFATLWRLTHWESIVRQGRWEIY